MGLFDSVKRMFGGKKGSGGSGPSAQLKKAAQKVDDKAEKLATKDGVVGDVAGKAHELLDKIDGD